MKNKNSINTSISKLITLGFSVIVLLVISIVIFLIGEFNDIKKLSSRVEELRTPTFNASSSMHSDVNSSLSSLHNLISMNNEDQRNNFYKNWADIYNDLTQLHELSENWTNPSNVEKLTKIDSLISEFNLVQNNIIQQASEQGASVPLKFFTDNLEPLFHNMQSSLNRLTTILNTTSMDQEHQNIERIVYILQSNLKHNKDQLELIILSGEQLKINNFEISWVENQVVFEQLKTLTGSIPQRARPLVDEYEKQELEFYQLAKEIIDLKANEGEKVYLTELRTIALPLKEEIMGLLDQMVDDQISLLEIDNRELELQIESLLKVTTIAFSFAIAFSIWLGFTIIRRTRKIEEQILNRNHLVDQNILISTLDSDGHILDISNQLCRELSVVKDEVIGEQSNFFIKTDDGNSQFDQINAIIKTGAIWSGEIERQNAYGNNKWFKSTIIPETQNGGRICYSNILENITDKKRSEMLSITDKLTGIFNRRHFDKIIEKEIQLARRRKAFLTFAIIDIDYFKQFNDNYGHPEGDRILRLVAQNLQKHMQRPDDYVFRLGGEEFGVLFSSSDLEQSQQFLESLRENIELLNIPHDFSEVSKYLTISIGGACCDGMAAPDAFEFYELSEQALYEAKVKRNSVEIVGV